MKKVLVIGDVCKDVFHYVKCERLCPEAPVPVVTVVETKSNDGMAGNVARNIKSLGLEADSICNEEQITKTRYVDDNTNQMFIRVDSQNEVTKLENLDRKKVWNMKFTILISGGVIFLGGIREIYHVSTENSVAFYLGVLWMALGAIFFYIGLLTYNEIK